MDAKPLAIIIEDNVDQNLVFTTAIQQAGFITESIHDGVTAMERLGKVVPALVILDLHVPGINGGMLLRGIRNDPLTANTHVVIVSADPEFATMLRPQVDLVLIKPVSFPQLVEVARNFKTAKSAS